MTISEFPFRDDSGNVFWVNFETMMEADSCGFLEIGGVPTRRARDLEESPVKSRDLPTRVDGLSDALGCTVHGVQERMEHIKRHSLKGVEFVEDKDVPNFFQLKYDTEASKLSYAKSLGWADLNSRNGSAAMLSEKDFEDAKDLVLREHGAACESLGT